MKTNKEKETRSVNEKFVNMLKRTFDKYKDITVLERRGEENVDPDENEAVEKFETTSLEPACKPSIDKKSGRRSGGKSKKLYHLRIFTPDEDKIILKTMKSAENKFAGVAEVAKALNRPKRSIYSRIDLLGSGSGIRRLKTFSLQEDFLIIDNVLKSLKQCKSLEETQLQDHLKIAESLDRPRNSAYERWNTQIKAWLLQYYQKTLNLEIRLMLINVLAENFDSIESIDWEWVKKVPEFSGYTAKGLKRLFVTKIIQLIDREFEFDRTDMTLQELKEAAKDFNFRKVKNSVMDRQRKVIDYFEKHVEMDGIQFREKGLRG